MNINVYFKNPVQEKFQIDENTYVDTLNINSENINDEKFTDDIINRYITYINNMFPYMKYEVSNNKVFIQKKKISSNFNNEVKNNYESIRNHANNYFKELTNARNKYDEIETKFPNSMFNEIKIEAIVSISQNEDYKNVSSDKYWIRNQIESTKDFDDFSLQFGICTYKQKIEKIKRKPTSYKNTFSENTFSEKVCQNNDTDNDNNKNTINETNSVNNKDTNITKSTTSKNKNKNNTKLTLAEIKKQYQSRHNQN